MITAFSLIYMYCLPLQKLPNDEFSKCMDYFTWCIYNEKLTFEVCKCQR